jgi:hypothetical protein
MWVGVIRRIYGRLEVSPSLTSAGLKYRTAISSTLCRATRRGLSARAHSSREPTEPALEAFAARVRASWGQSFAGLIDPEEIDVMVENILVRIRQRRDAIEASGTGTA